MLSLYAATQSFNAPVLHVAQQPAVRSSPVQMMEMSSRRAALLSAATLAIPGVANAATAVWQVNPEGWGSKKYGGAQADATSTPAQALDPSRDLSRHISPCATPLKITSRMKNTFCACRHRVQR